MFANEDLGKSKAVTSIEAFEGIKNSILYNPEFAMNFIISKIPRTDQSSFNQDRLDFLYYILQCNNQSTSVNDYDLRIVTVADWLFGNEKERCRKLLAHNGVPEGFVYKELQRFPQKEFMYPWWEEEQNGFRD